jgi:ribosomal 30S subunit maturation factor RimM
MIRHARAASAAFLLLLVPAALHAQERQSERAFTLNERVPAGQWLRVRNVIGEVRVTPSTSDRVEIVATKSWRRGNPKMVRIESTKSSDGSILVCAYWQENATCDENGYRSHGDSHDRNNDVAVDFDVRVPRGVNVGAFSVNGQVSVEGATAQVQAATVNGNVVAEFRADIAANVELRTENGRFQTDWPVTVTGRLDPRHLRATLGKGGRRLRLATVNGNVELRKSQ